MRETGCVPGKIDGEIGTTCHRRGRECRSSRPGNGRDFAVDCEVCPSHCWGIVRATQRDIEPPPASLSSGPCTVCVVCDLRVTIRAVNDSCATTANRNRTLLAKSGTVEVTDTCLNSTVCETVVAIQGCNPLSHHGNLCLVVFDVLTEIPLDIYSVITIVPDSPPS